MIRYKSVFLAVMSLNSSFSFAKVVEIDFGIYGKGTMLANSPGERQSANYWHQLSNKIMASESKLGTQKMWQYAGLSEALAAIAANKHNDVKAYEYWSNSTRYLLTGGTEWPQMQKYLHRRYENINTQLSTQLTTSDVGVSLDNQWQQELTILQIWEEKLGVLTFKGPKLGLKSAPSSTSYNESHVIETPDYNSTRATKASEGRSKKKLTGLSRSFSRGQSVIPVVNEEVQDKKESIKTEQPPSNKSNTVVITPDEEFDYRAVEKNNEKEDKVIDKTVYNPIHKANIGTEDKNKVEVLQRRTFIPTVTEESK